MNFLRSNKSQDIQATLDWLFSNPASPYYCRSQFSSKCNGVFDLVLHFAAPTTPKTSPRKSHTSACTSGTSGNILLALLENAVNRLFPTASLLVTVDPAQKSCANSAIVEGCITVNSSHPNSIDQIKTQQDLQTHSFDLFPIPEVGTNNTTTLSEVYTEIASLLFQLFSPYYEDLNWASQLAHAIAADPVTCFNSVITWCKEESSNTGTTVDPSRIPVPATYDSILRDVKTIASRAQQSLHSILSCSLFKMRYFKTKSDRNAFWYCHPLRSATLDWSAHSDGLRRLQSIHPQLPTLLHTTIFLTSGVSSAINCLVLPGYQVAGSDSPTLGVMRWVSELMDYLLSCARSKSEPNRNHVLPTRKPKTVTGYPPLKNTFGPTRDSADRAITVSDVCSMLIYYHAISVKYMVIV